MGFVLRSAMGLGAVYFAMFGQGLRTAEMAPKDPCLVAADAGLRGESGLPAQWAAAACAAKFARLAPRASPPLVAATTLNVPPPPRAGAPVKPASGTLTAADLQSPWFGPAGIQRRGGSRG